MKTPYTAKRDKDTVHYTYLDTIGRPVVTLHKDNLVEQHILDFEVVADIFHTTISLIYKLFLLSENTVFQILELDPNHIGITGNAKADQAAKSALNLLNITDCTLPIF